MENQAAWLSLLRCPRSGEPIRRESEELVSRAELELEQWRTCGFLGFCVFMNSYVLVFNRLFRWAPGIRKIAALAARFDELVLRLPGMSRTGTQVIGSARRPGQPSARVDHGV